MLLNLSPEKRAELRHHLNDYITTADRIQFLGLEDRVEMGSWIDSYKVDLGDPACGTTCCMAGWHSTFQLIEKTGDRAVSEQDVDSESMTWTKEVVNAYRGASLADLFGKVPWSYEDGELHKEENRRQQMFNVLFGVNRGNGPETLKKLNKAATLLLWRLDRLDEADRRMDLPKAERPDHSQIPEPV